MPVSPFGTMADIMLRHLLLPAEHAMNYRPAIPFSRYRLACFYEIGPALQVSNSHGSEQVVVQTYSVLPSFYSKSEKRGNLFCS